MSSTHPWQHLLAQNGKQCFGSFFQHRVGNATASQDGLINPMNARRTFKGDAHHAWLVLKASQVFTTLLHCFIATNSEPNELDSQLVCFFKSQQTGALLRHANNPLLDRPTHGLQILVLVVWACLGEAPPSLVWGQTCLRSSPSYQRQTRLSLDHLDHAPSQCCGASSDTQTLGRAGIDVPP
jgi:hypothetical protein